MKLNLTSLDTYLLERAITLDNNELATLMRECDQNREEDRFINIILNIYYYCNLLQEFNEPERISNEELSEMANRVNGMTIFNNLYQSVQPELEGDNRNV